MVTQHIMVWPVSKRRQEQSCIGQECIKVQIRLVCNYSATSRKCYFGWDSAVQNATRSVTDARQLLAEARHGHRMLTEAILSCEQVDGPNQKPSLTAGTLAVRYRSYGITVLFVMLATIVCLLGRHFLVLTDLAIAYLYVIVVSALLFRRGPAVFASALSVLAFDFFFVPPVFQLNIADVHYIFTFCMMFFVGLLVATLAARIRRERQNSIERERRTAALFALSRDLGRATDELEAAGELVRHSAAAFDANATLLMADTDGTLKIAANVGTTTSGRREQLAIALTYEHGLVAGYGTNRYPDAKIVSVPMAAAGVTVGVLAVEVLSTSVFGDAQREMLESFGRQGGVCVAGLRSAMELKLAEMQVRTEAVRSALLTSVSHDLRTPLAVITEAATMLRDDAELLSPSQRTDMVATVCEEAERMDRLVANLLDMTRLESGKLTLRREWVSCEELVGAALNIAKSKTTHLTISTNLEPDLPLVAVDASLVEQLLANIFENAAKYAGPHATVNIAARAHESGLILEVADDGPGIPPGSEERIFEKFHRAGSNSVGGSGLGLAICRAIADIHGCAISASNRAAGGAVFSLTIPIVGVPPALPSEREALRLE